MANDYSRFNDGPDTLTIPLSLALTVVTGRLLCDFNDMQGFVSWFVRDSVFTLGLTVASPLVASRILEQHPSLSDVDATGVTPDNWQTWLADQQAEYGAALSVTRGATIPPPPHGAWI